MGIERSETPLPPTPDNNVISTEATTSRHLDRSSDSLTVRCAVEKPVLSEVEGTSVFRLCRVPHVSLLKHGYRAQRDLFLPKSHAPNSYNLFMSGFKFRTLLLALTLSLTVSANAQQPTPDSTARLI